MLLKDVGIGLRFYAVGNTSSVGVWLTRAHGKLATRMKGHQRATSRLLGQADVFYTCELLFYARETRNVHIMKEVTPLAWRQRLREDWRACALASYLAWLADRSMPFGPAGEGFFALLEEGLDQVANRSAGPATLLRFEARWLALLGAMPEMGRCSRCGRALAAGEDGVPGADGHGLYCRDCAGEVVGAGEGAGSGWAALSGAGRAALAELAEAGQPERAGLPAGVYREVETVLGRMVAGALELGAPSRERAAALEIVERREGEAGR